MPAIQIRDVPDATHRALRRRAQDAGQSLQQYLMRILDREAATPTNAEIFTRIERDERGGRMGLDDAVDAIHAARERR